MNGMDELRKAVEEWRRRMRELLPLAYEFALQMIASGRRAQETLASLPPSVRKDRRSVLKSLVRGGEKMEARFRADGCTEEMIDQLVEAYRKREARESEETDASDQGDSGS